MAVLVCVLCALGWVLARVRGRGDVGRGVDKWGFGHAWRRGGDGGGGCIWGSCGVWVSARLTA